MEDNDLRIVRITNISDFDFTGDLGARYGGRDFSVPAGKSLLTPFTVGDHLATHLARQIMLKNAPIRDAKELDGKGSDRPLWDEARVAELKSKIMKDVYEEERVNPTSEADKMAEKIAELNKVLPVEEGGNADASVIEMTESGSDFVYQDKAQIIAELKKREISFDPRLGKNKLEALLTAEVVE